MGVQFPDGRQHVFTTGVDTDGEPVEADGTFLASNFSSVVVEMTVWELAEAGEIDLNEPIATWAPTIPNADEITLEMVLNRTTGLGDAYTPMLDALLAGPDRTWSLEESIEVLSQIPPLGDPGTRIDEDDVGPAVIIGHSMEEATGRTLGELVDDYVAEPLGLRSLAFTTLDRPPTEWGRVVNPDGTSYDIDGADVNGESFVTGGAPAWGIQTSMADLLTTLDAIATGVLLGPDHAPRPAAYPPDRYLADRPDLLFGIDTPVVAYCPCTGDVQNRTYSSYGRSGGIAGTSFSMVTFPDSGISMSIRPQRLVRRRSRHATAPLRGPRPDQRRLRSSLRYRRAR